MGKTKHNPPRRSKPGFIEFSNLQRSYLNEVLTRQRAEFNAAVNTVYDELGVTDKIIKAPPGTYILKQDCSGLEVHVVKPESGKKTGAAGLLAKLKKSGSEEEGLAGGLQRGKGKKDN